jgi:AcrR family transcriptional regulator
MAGNVEKRAILILCWKQSGVDCLRIPHWECIEGEHRAESEFASAAQFARQKSEHLGRRRFGCAERFECAISWAIYMAVRMPGDLVQSSRAASKAGSTGSAEASKVASSKTKAFKTNASKPEALRSKKRKTSRRGRPKAQSRGEAADTRDNILQAAVKVFAERGLGGGRINLVSRAARSNDRMIYYYFGSKEKLFIEVLEKIYRDMWEAESKLDLDLSEPVAALKHIVHFTMNHYLAHPEMLTLLNNENLHKGKYVSKSKAMKELSSPALDLMEQVYRAGVKQGVFRRGIAPLHIYLTILALNYFYVSNRYTLSAFLGLDLMGGDSLPGWRDWVEEVVLRAVRV